VNFLDADTVLLQGETRCHPMGLRNFLSSGPSSSPLENARVDPEAQGAVMSM
jgi:hypothetical protein